MTSRPRANAVQGMTMIELVIVMAVMCILMATAMPGYQGYMLRVHRTEAIRLLLQASMCQERVHAAHGTYDTGQCHPESEYKRYQLVFEPLDTQGQAFTAVAIPTGAQISDRCGSLSLDQNGARGITATDTSVMKCWSGR